MNLFRFLGNLCHVGANAYLIQRIRETQSVRGVSLKTSQLALLAFITRYMDILHPGGFLQLVLRVASVATAAYILVLFRVFGGSRYGGHDPALDAASRLHLLVPCAVLALLFHYKWQVTHVAAEFATFLEAVSVWPQLTVLHNLPPAAVPAPLGSGSGSGSATSGSGNGSGLTRVLFDAGTASPAPEHGHGHDGLPPPARPLSPAAGPGTVPSPTAAAAAVAGSEGPSTPANGKTLSPQELEPTLLDRNYLFLLAAYRLLYIPGWLYRYFKFTALDPIEMVASGVGIALLVDLFHLYYTKFAPNRTYELPA